MRRLDFHITQGIYLLQEMGRTDLRLMPGQAARFARLTGYTHMAVGVITGKPSHCSLTYQLYTMPKGLKVRNYFLKCCENFFVEIKRKQSVGILPT